MRQLLFRLEFCEYGNTDNKIDLDFDPNDWIKRHPEVAEDLAWLRLDGGLLPWNEWDARRRRDLRRAFWRCRLQIGNGIPDAPSEASPDGLDVGAGTYYREDLAWRVFIASVAQCLACEEARWVGWSLLDLPRSQRSQFFDARAYFTRSSAPGRYFPFNGEAFSFYGSPGQRGATDYITLADPTAVYRFMTGRALVGSSRGRTVLNVMDWGRLTLEHYSGAIDPENCRNHWGYSGFPPISRVLAGTTRAGDGHAAHFTAGCQGTVAVLRALLRTVNVPVHYWNLGHYLPEFPSEGRFLSHGDDLYGQGLAFTPPPPIQEYWIDQPTFDRWFVPPGNRANNIGRQPRELMIRYPRSDYILRLRCRDLAAGRGHDSTYLDPQTGEHSVYSDFRNDYTPAELESTGFWARLAAELTARGGCAAIP